LYSSLFKFVTERKGPERVKCFIWKLCHECIMTNVRRMRMNLTNSNLCPACDFHEEALLRRFRDCYHASWVWQFFIQRNNGVDFYSITDWKTWLQTNLTMTHLVHEMNCSLLFGGMLDFMWWRRNRIIGLFWRLFRKLAIWLVHIKLLYLFISLLVLRTWFI